MRSRLVSVGLLVAMVGASVHFPSANAQNTNSSQTTSNQTDTKRAPAKKKVRGQTITLKGRELAESERPQVKATRDEVLGRGKVEQPKTRGPYCDVYVSNRTGFYVDIYVDDEWAGTIGPRTRAHTTAWPGATSVYGVSGTLYWGPRNYTCGSNQYIDFVMIP